jgi:TM2 domain-containing membrane protein YozV
MILGCTGLPTCLTSNKTEMVAQKDTLVAYILWFFFGFLGIHRFYLNRPVSGIIWLLTGGLCGLGWCIDLCLIPMMVDEENAMLQPAFQTVVIQQNQQMYHPQQYAPQPYAQQPYSPQPYRPPQYVPTVFCCVFNNVLNNC